MAIKEADDDLNPSGMKVNISANHVTVARRLVKSLGIDYLTRGGHFISRSIAFDLAHMVSVAKNLKQPYQEVVRERVVGHYLANKQLYKRIADLVNKSNP